jgi:hypothetical protein
MQRRIPRKTKSGKVRPASKHSDLYTDERPSDTVSINKKIFCSKNTNFNRWRAEVKSHGQKSSS